MCVLSVKVTIRKKSGTLFNDPRMQEKCIIINVVNTSTTTLSTVETEALSFG